MLRRAVVMGFLVVVGCGGAATEGGGGAKAADTRTLFLRLGGQPAINAVVHDFLVNVTQDKRIAMRFNNPDGGAHLEQMLQEQICNATGGGCPYTGKSMEEVHTGMNITDEEFTALVEDLTKSLVAHKVPEKEKNELLGALGGMKPQIVGR